MAATQVYSSVSHFVLMLLEEVFLRLWRSRTANTFQIIFPWMHVHLRVVEVTGYWHAPGWIPTVFGKHLLLFRHSC